MLRGERAVLCQQWIFVIERKVLGCKIFNIQGCGSHIFSSSALLWITLAWAQHTNTHITLLLTFTVGQKSSNFECDSYKQKMRKKAVLLISAVKFLSLPFTVSRSSSSCVDLYILYIGINYQSIFIFLLSWPKSWPRLCFIWLSLGDYLLQVFMLVGCFLFVLFKNQLNVQGITKNLE